MQKCPCPVCVPHARVCSTVLQKSVLEEGFRKRSRGVAHGKMDVSENEVVCSKEFLRCTGNVPCFVKYPTSPVLGKNIKLRSGNQAVIYFFELSVNHDEKNYAVIYNWLSLNDDKRLNTVPAKSTTWKRVN